MLVLALGAGLEETKTTLDRELDRLVVAELEVQVSPLFGGAPVASEESPILEEVERPRDRAARGLVAREDEQGAVPHRPEDLLEERPREVREPPLPVERAEVEPVHDGRVLVPERLPRETLDGQAFLPELAALARDLAAALARQRLEVVGERAVAAVAPVELQRVTHREPVFRELAELLLGEEERVRRADRELVAELSRRVEQGALDRRVDGFADVAAHEELRTRGWRERHGGDELRVVPEPVFPVRPRPLPVEDVLAVAVGLEVEGERAEETPAVPAGQVGRRPPARAADTARALERAQELEVEEREIRWLERSPGRLVHLLDA